MTTRALAALVAAAALHAAAQSPAPNTDDPYLWLEDVTGDKALAWVRERNAESQPLLEAKPGFKALQERLVAVYSSKDRIPAVQALGPRLYNFWQDEAHPRGVWRRTTMDEYRKAQPAWETVLDLDKLSADEKESWVWKGAACLFPDYERCILRLSRKGADAVVMREFDTAKREFVKGGFTLPEAKGDVAWRDADTLYVATDFGAGTMTTSGYPRIVKEWKRGTPLAAARTVFEGAASDVGVDVSVLNETQGWRTEVAPVDPKALINPNELRRQKVTRHEVVNRYETIRRATDFWNSEKLLRRGDQWVKLDVPTDSVAYFGHGRLFLRLRTDWKPGAVTFQAGSLLNLPLGEFLAGKRDFAVAFAPSEGVSLERVVFTRRYVVLEVLDHVKGRVLQGHRRYGKLLFKDVPLPPAAAVSVSAVDRNATDDFWLTLTGFTEPTTLSLVNPGRLSVEKVKSMPAFFDAKGLAVTQHEATSKDGTRVPYFVVAREGMKADGTNPTILYGYGGFEIAMKPSYSGAVGAGWLERGGTWVLANIRGGGEFGPEWHRTAQREGRQKAYDDFIAVAEDLIKRGITSAPKLGIMGGSQGGLLVGGTLVQRPELFGAAVASVPLLDMKRYHKLLAGASWMGEYGDPDKPADWAFISKYSPYQNVSKDRKYPRTLFTTSTRDDRVHPGHARKMVARMKEQGHDVLYFEYVEGGHGAGSLPAQQAYTWALIYTFFADTLGLK